MTHCIKKYLVEFIGTFFLIFTIGASVMNSAKLIPSVAIGTVLMVLVYSGYKISGGHFNPAVSLAALIRGVLSFKDLFFYWIAQLLGATAAAYTVVGISHGRTLIAELDYGVWPMVISELLLTFLLCYVVLLTATSKDTEHNSYFGLAIGGTLLVAVMIAGGIYSYGAFNPAAALGLGILGSAKWLLLLYTVIANFLGAILAALVYKMVEHRDNY